MTQTQLFSHVFVRKNCSWQYNAAEVEDVVKNNKSLFVNFIKMRLIRKLPELQVDCRLKAFIRMVIHICDQDI